MNIYSIGYATKPIGDFLEQLELHGIDVVADVRSVPFSAAFHDFHQPALQKVLPAAKIKYVYLGDELGPRSKDLTHYDSSGQVQFDRLMLSDLFLKGIERLQVGMEKELNIALMCAEKDAATCHRSLLVGHYLLHEKEIEVKHINHHGEIESQKALEKRLVDIQGLVPDMLTAQEEIEQLAYQQQLKQTSYKRPD